MATAAVLVVEDESSVREFLRHWLEEWGYAVLQTKNRYKGLTASLVVAIFVVCGDLIPIHAQTAAVHEVTAESFLETFDGDPIAPVPFSSRNWDIQVHERGMIHRAPGEQSRMKAQHGYDCGPPSATHSVSNSDYSVFNCRNHLMTSLNGDEYGVIYLTPNHMLDWSSGSAVLSFDLSTEKMSVRDWPDLILTPWNDQQALPLLSPLSQGVDLQGPSRNTVVISFATSEGAPVLTIIRNGAREEFTRGTPLSSGVAAGTNQSVTRQPLKLTISDTHVRFERLASATGSAIVWFDQDVPAIGFNQAVVQLGHHSYNPFKDGAGVAGTWHWDNISLNPSVAFTILKVTPKYVYDSATLTFPPAPANSILRFAASGRPVVNGVARDPVVYNGQPEHASSYNVAIPAGSTSATISLTAHDWYNCGFGCLAKDFSIFSQTDSK
jgi:hypothetical protein